MKKIFYFAISKSDETRFNSTSGGIFSEIADYVLDKSGYVSGAAFNQNLKLEHIVIDSKRDLNRIRKSKYLESSSFLVYKTIKSLLDNKKFVLFSGTPCQVGGLKAFLGKDYDQLITIDFICRGVNSPKAFEAWVKEVESKNCKKVKNVWFKYKVGGWNSSPMRTRVDFEDNSFVVFEGLKNLYMHGYLYNNLYLRPSCSKCLFKGNERHSDITVGDFWGLDKKLDDDKGASFIMINTKKGKELFNEISSKLIFKEMKNFVFDANPMFSANVIRSDKSSLFLSYLDKYSFRKSLKKVKLYPKKHKVIDFLLVLRKKFKNEGK